MKPTGDVGVYVHFPYCRSRCPYCDFKVDVVRSIPGAAYREAVLAELEARLTEALRARRLRSLYFGGGTPSLWEAASITRVIEAVATAFKADASALEITVEANPRELDAERVASLAGAGVNRLSVGVQSFDDAALRWLGRDHDAQTARAALECVLRAGLQRVTFDLIAALPSRGLADWRRELGAAERFLGAGHLSVYELTIHEGTRFGRLHAEGRLEPADEDLAEAVLAETEAFLEGHGLSHYEVSNYARPGLEAVHNGLYWSGAEYLGLGVGAHSMLVEEDAVVRRENSRLTARYLEDPGLEPLAEERLDALTHLRERVFLGLRTRAGVDLGAVSGQLGVAVPDDVRLGLERCRERGWVVVEGERWRPTRLGLRFADAIGEAVV